MRKFWLIVAAFGVAARMMAFTPARADWDGWRSPGWREHQWREHERWREHEWREHHSYTPGYIYRAPSGLYYPPPMYYAAPPTISPPITFGFPVR
jgi:hypothetical protein